MTTNGGYVALESANGRASAFLLPRTEGRS
jgi:hypothetical protein